jgi:tetratricopeptide (TPR) repeat protein
MNLDDHVLSSDGNGPPEPAPPGLPLFEPAPPPASAEEILRPTPVSLRRPPGTADSAAQRPAVVALATDGVYVQETWQTSRIAWASIAAVEAGCRGREVVLKLGAEAAGEVLILRFAGRSERLRWHEALLTHRPQAGTDASTPVDRVLEGVLLLRGASSEPHEYVGAVAFEGSNRWSADRGLQLRAAMRGANAVLRVEREACSDRGLGWRRATGTGVRFGDPTVGNRLRLEWYAGEVRNFLKRALRLLAVQAALLLIGVTLCTGVSPLAAPTGEPPLQQAGWGAAWLAGIYAWPLILLGLLSVVRAPLLIRAAGAGVLAVTTGRVLAAWGGHAVAAISSGMVGLAFLVVLDPVDWAFIIAGIHACRRAWGLARDASLILPREAQADSGVQRGVAAGTLVLTGVLGVGLMGWVGVERFHTSTYILQPGFDARREQEARLAFNEGVEHVAQNDLPAAERAFRKSAGLWEQLTAAPSVPVVYRQELVRTLYSLGWIAAQQDQAAEAEKHFARVVELAEQPGVDADATEEWRQQIAAAREGLWAYREGMLEKGLLAKETSAVRKFEEGQVKEDEAPAEAGRLFREAIGLWEEVQGQATNPAYRKSTTGRLATAYLALGDALVRSGKPSDAEPALKKAVALGEQAVEESPDRPLYKHNLELAQQMLERERERHLQEEIERACQAEHFAQAVELHERGIAELRDRAGLAKAGARERRRLAFRLDRFAWFLAHCPDARVRDPRDAVRRARQATEFDPEDGDYWFTLATAQYRKGDWRDSLVTLEQVKARTPEGPPANVWYLTAMNRHQLRESVEARQALRKAADWMEERRRKAEDNPVPRFQYEMLRLSVEPLRREAEALIEGKEPAHARSGSSSREFLKFIGLSPATLTRSISEARRPSLAGASG